MTQESLQLAITLASAGQKDQARELLQQVLKANPVNEMAWLWLTDCVTTREERIQVLETCLQFVPGSQAAQAGLAALRAQPEPGIEQTNEAAEPSQPAAEPSQPVAEPSQPAAEAPQAQEREPYPGEEQPVTAEAIPPAEVEPPPAEVETTPPAPAFAEQSDTAADLPLDSEPSPTSPADLPPDVSSETIEPTDAGEQQDEEENEWPQLRDQIQLEPWMEDMADEAGPALGALLGNQDESGGLPGRAKAYDNLPTLPVRKTEPPPAFTIPPEEVSDEEFSEVETRTQSELRNRPVIRPSQTQTEDNLFDPNYLRSEEEGEPETQSLAGQVDEEGKPDDDEGLLTGDRDQEPDSQVVEAGSGSDAIEKTQPTGITQSKPRTSQIVLYVILILLGLIGIAAVVAGLTFFN